jgi:hypothetical protein
MFIRLRLLVVARTFRWLLVASWRVRLVCCAGGGGRALAACNRAGLAAFVRPCPYREPVSGSATCDTAAVGPGASVVCQRKVRLHPWLETPARRDASWRWWT